MNFVQKQKEMIENQLKSRGIKDEKVLNAMVCVPRHFFVEHALEERAYEDYPLPIGEGQTISQPYMVALMTESLQLDGSEKVLEIGTGSGYQTAVLAEIVEQVYTIERIERLAKRARKILEELGYKNIISKVGDGTLGWEEFAPYDSILITAGSPEVPEKLFIQLKEGGKMVIPLGDSHSQVLTLVEKKKGKEITTPICGCTFVPLIGRYGWGMTGRSAAR